MSETATDTTTKIVWFEAPASDTERARAFYGQLFGWQFEAFGDMDYHMTYEGGGAIQGGAGETAILVYFGVVDVDAAVARVRDLGGEAGEVQETPGVGRYVRCTDSEGNAFGLYEQTASA